MKKTSETLPKWNLTNIYKNFDDPSYEGDIKDYLALCAELKTLLSKGKKEALEETVQLLGRAMDLMENLFSYAYALFSVNTGDNRALREVSRLEEAHQKLAECFVLFNSLVKKHKKDIPALLKKSPILAERAQFMKDSLMEAEHQMSDTEEALAQELKAAGGDAWGRLQEAVSSSLSGDGKSITELRNLAFDRSRSVRKKAYEAELAAWKSMEIPLAYSLNGVKKTAATLENRRSWKSALEKSLFQSRMSAKTLEAMISVMEESLPEFRKYLKKKAELLGIKQLAFYDLFAPISEKAFKPKVWSFDEARDYIIQTFGSFADDMGLFAKNAFENGWIDSPPHTGKVGGAYCTSFPIAKESRVMCNFSPTFSGVSTIAHELGHAYHFHLLREECAFSRAYPMTLAETASIFSETMLYNCTISRAKGFEKKYLTEMFLMEVTQVIVDILCRFYFEKAVFEKQKEGPLSAGDLCGMMLDAQKATYGDALDPKQLHPYMWAVKCHYYSPDLGFYNYPYAFGQLFSIGLYAKYLEDKKRFPALYRKVLMATGRTDIKGVAKLAGIDVEKKDFFQESMNFITRMIRSFLR
ncbi:MAG: M3 family oligoendopeptidase [Spirochaetia bacterium]|nr:M3 family oligoendopeptidase [Spirochaetia bacterium]